jgi:hypothetical protein
MYIKTTLFAILNFIQITCQNHRSKHFNFQYIYRISYKIAKKGKPDEMDLPLLKNDITGSEPTVKMTDT